ncbi:unnamed protein product [Sphagnum jensenii]|uniref:Uncharacterized protein n=1 Tax=Sphagnum jensenii TaxID=128206 RepID=A0ABP0VK99_9BRYO
MPPSNVFDLPNPSLMIEDLEVFTKSQDVQACDPTNNYLSSPSNQSLSIEDYEDWATMVDGTTSNRVLPEFDTGFESWAMGVSERTLCDHVEVQPNSIEDQSTNVTERTFSEHVGAQQNSIHNEWDSAKLASAGPVLFSQHNAYPKSKDVSIQEPHAIDELSNLSTNPSPTPLFHIEIRSPLGVQDVSGEFSKLSIFVNDGWKLSIDPKCQAPTSLHESNLTVERQLETTHTFISFQKFGDVQLGDKWLVLQDFIDRGWKLSVFKK